MADITCSYCGATNPPLSKQCLVCLRQLPLAGPAIVPASQPQPTQLMPSGGGGGAELVLPNKTSLPLGPITTVGRDQNQCNLVFSDDERMSRKHARIEEQGGSWVLTDLGSSNGTFVNDVFVSAPTRLQSGDKINMGNSIFIFHLAGHPLVPSVQKPLAPMLGGGGSILYPPPPGGWRQWKTPPAVEGHVRSITERYTMKKDDLMKRGIAAAALGLLISPALVFLPFMHGSDITVRDMRVEDHISGRQADVMMRGDVLGNINQGDPVAVWGPVQGGLILMEAAYNYHTDTEIRIKK